MYSNTTPHLGPVVGHNTAAVDITEGGELAQPSPYSVATTDADTVNPTQKCPPEVPPHATSTEIVENALLGPPFLPCDSTSSPHKPARGSSTLSAPYRRSSVDVEVKEEGTTLSTQVILTKFESPVPFIPSIYAISESNPVLTFTVALEDCRAVPESPSAKDILLLSHSATKIAKSASWAKTTLEAILKSGDGLREKSPHLTHPIICYIYDLIMATAKSGDKRKQVYETMHPSDVSHVMEVIDYLLKSLDVQALPLDGAHPAIGINGAFPILSRIAIDLADKHFVLPKRLWVEDVVRSEKLVGGGAFADVLEGKRNGVSVAIKRLRCGKVQDQKPVWRSLCREVLTGAYLEHPNILPVLGIDRDAYGCGFYCMVTKWANFGSVRSYMKDNKAITVSVINQWVLGIARGLAYLHKWGLVHGDIRGNNILVNEHERACISDMGQAFLLDHVERNFTNAGGSTPWTAPELFQYSDSVLMRPTFKTDVYAFACTVVELYTCQNPWKGKSEFEIMRSVSAGHRPVPDPNVFMPHGLWPLIMKCWSEDAACRPPMADIADCICKLLSN